MNHNEHSENRDGPAYNEDTTATGHWSHRSSHWRSPIYEQLAKERASESSGNENDNP